MHRTTAGRTALAAALYALVLWGHVTLVETGAFALLLACVAAAAVLAGTRRAPAASAAPDPSGRSRAALPEVPGDIDVATERESLRRLEAELHALEDQLHSASHRGDPGRPWGGAELSRG